MKVLIKTPVGIFEFTEAHKQLKAAEIQANDETFKPLTVATELWGPNPAKPGYLSLIRRRTIGEVLTELQEYLPHYIPEYKEFFEGMSFCWWGDKKMHHGDDFPAFHWLSCYLVTGNSEGHYIHFDVIDREGARQSMFQEKTFSGSAAGWKIVEAIATILEA